MKVLFVCKSNIGRSPAAAFFFNTYSQKHHATSAGIRDVEEGEREIKNIPSAQGTIQSFLKYGFDVSNFERRQITEDIFNDADRVYVLMEKHEKDLPTYITDSPKIIFHPFINGKELKGEDRENLTKDIIQFAQNLAESLDKDLE
jgi:protein-tyrosine-phosphatase